MNPTLFLRIQDNANQNVCTTKPKKANDFCYIILALYISWYRFYTWMARRRALVVSTPQRSVTYVFTRGAVTITALKKKT